MATLTYTSPVSSKSYTTSGEHWFDLNTAGAWFRSNGLPSNAVISSAIFTLYVASDANNEITCQLSLHSNSGGSGNGTTGLIVDFKASSGSTSSYKSGSSGNVVGHMDASNPGYFLSDRDWAKAYTYVSWSLRSRNFNVYYTLKIDFEIPHTHSSEVRNAYAATCTATGYTGDTYCKGCGVKISSGSPIAIDPNNHSGSQTILAAVAPTCEATGLTEGKKWSCCNVIITAQQTVPALGHTAGTPVTENRVEATCTTDGSYDEVVYCTVCGVELSRTKKTISATGHSYTTETFDPTETDAGYTRYTCSVCGHSYDADFKCRLNISAENGTVSGVVDGGVYTMNSQVRFTAIPDEGYKFKSATAYYPDGSSRYFTNNTGVLTFTNNITFVVKFSPTLPEITSVQMLYQGRQISSSNKVPAEEYFRIVVAAVAHD